MNTLARDATVTKNPPTRTYRGGPGSLEMVTITTWTNRHGIGWIRVYGEYDVYCGNGAEHRVDLDVREWAADHVGADIDDAAHAVIARALDNDWFDPCEDALSMPEPEGEA